MQWVTDIIFLRVNIDQGQKTQINIVNIKWDEHAPDLQGAQVVFAIIPW